MRRVLAFSVLLAAVLAHVLPPRVLAAVEVQEVSSLPGWCAASVRVAGESRSAGVDVEEVRAECAWLGRQFAELSARVSVFAQPVVASGSRWEEAGYRAPGGRPVEGDRIGGLASRSGSEACVFDCLGADAFAVAHELGHLVWFQLLSPGRRADYVSLRGLQGKPEWYVWECFAEDFRLAFSSRGARLYDHQLLGGGPPACFAGFFAGMRQPAGRLSWAVSDGRVDVFVEERPVPFPDVQPWVDTEGRGWVPVRFVVEKLGWAVWYDVRFGRARACGKQSRLEFDLHAGTGPAGLEFVVREGRICCPLDQLAVAVEGEVELCSAARRAAP